MITLALSLLLVFKTNSSYGRFWEARTLWGGLVNLSRDLARLVSGRHVVRGHVVRGHVVRGHAEGAGVLRYELPRLSAWQCWHSWGIWSVTGSASRVCLRRGSSQQHQEQLSCCDPRPDS